MGLSPSRGDKAWKGRRAATGRGQRAGSVEKSFQIPLIFGGARSPGVSHRWIWGEYEVECLCFFNRWERHGAGACRPSLCGALWGVLVEDPRDERTGTKLHGGKVLSGLERTP